MATKTRQFDPTTLNSKALRLWFDDLGTGNEENRFLSNFYRGEDFTLPGVTWEALDTACKAGPWGNVDPDKTSGRTGPIPFPTGEHAFAAMKFWGTDIDHFISIVDSDPDDPNVCKSLGRSRSHPLREDWEIVKMDVMAAVTRSKYALGRAEAEALLATDDAFLCEGTFWYDDVWGVDLNNVDMPGRNWLGSLLMMRRAELRAMVSFPDSVKVQKFGVNTTKSNTEFFI